MVENCCHNLSFLPVGLTEPSCETTENVSLAKERCCIVTMCYCPACAGCQLPGHTLQTRMTVVSSATDGSLSCPHTAAPWWFSDLPPHPISQFHRKVQLYAPGLSGDNTLVYLLLHKVYGKQVRINTQLHPEITTRANNKSIEQNIPWKWRESSGNRGDIDLYQGSVASTLWCPS